MEIKIAPELNEVVIDKYSIHTDWEGGITYECPIDELRKKYTDEQLKADFCCAIALSSRFYQIEQLLNMHYKVEGKLK